MADTDISEGRWLVQVAGIAGTFQTKTGGDAEVEHTKDFDGGSLDPNVYQGKPNFTDLTVGRGFRSPRDTAIVKDLQAKLKSGQRWSSTVTATPLNEQMVPIGAADVYQVVLKSVKGREGNANSAQPSRLELSFTVVTGQ